MMILVNPKGLVIQNTGIPDIYVSDKDFFDLIGKPEKAQKLRSVLKAGRNLLIGKLGENMGDFYVDLENYVVTKITIADNVKELNYYEKLQP